MAILLSGPFIIIIGSCALLTGLAAFAYFEHCDPLTAGWINATDQIIPYLSLYLFSENYPGVAGIYMSAVFGASLSTVSSGINSQSTVIIEDFVKPFWKGHSKREIKILSRVLTLLLGITVIGFAYMSRNFEGIIEACQSINGIVGGPTIGIFTLGIFFPYVSEIPAIIGLLLGLAVSVWVYVCSKSLDTLNQCIDKDFDTDA